MSNNVFGFVSEDTYTEKMDTQNRFLAAIAEGTGGGLKPTSWGNVQALVRTNLIDKVVGIADQFVAQRNSANLVWDVIGKNHDTPSDAQYDRSMTLQLHTQMSMPMQIDAPEAFYYCANGLPAGTYFFRIDSNYDTEYNTYRNTGYQFTLTSSVPVGGQLTFPWGYNVQASTAKVSSFASASDITPIESVSVSSGTSGTKICEISESGDLANNINSIHRVRFGSNNYKESAIRQWLNSDADIGNVWTPQTKFDRPPVWAETAAGFMHGMDADFLAAVGKTHIISERNNICDGGGVDELDDYFFLISRSECYMGIDSAGTAEGSPYPYYSDYSDLTIAGTEADSNRIKYRSGGAQSQYWWLRSPGVGHGALIRTVNSAGGMSNGSANDGYGIAPACNII